MLIGLVAVYDLHIHQNDCENIFPKKEKLEEEIYMEQPEDFLVPGKEKKVCKLVKSPCGLKTSVQIMTCEINVFTLNTSKSQGHCLFLC